MASGAAGVAIVGGSVAGVRCVRALRQSGYSDRIVLFDRQTETPYDKPTLSKDFLTEDNTAPTQLATAADLHAWTVEYRSATTATGLHTAGSKTRDERRARILRCSGRGDRMHPAFPALGRTE